MNKNLVLMFLLLFSIININLSQIPSDSLIFRKDHHLKHFEYLLDSVNLKNNNRDSLLTGAFKEFRIYDNKVREYNDNIQNQNRILNEQLDELLILTDQQKDVIDKDEELKVIVLIVISVLLLLFILFLVLFTNKAIKLKKIKFRIDNYESSYQENQELIENLTKENSELKSLELGLRKRNDKLEQEMNAKIKLLKADLDNSLNESKLLQKRLNEVSDELHKEKTERKNAEEENIQLKEKIFALEQNLNELKKQLEREISTRKNIEQELVQMLNQLKGL